MSIRRKIVNVHRGIRRLNQNWSEYEQKKLQEYENFTDNISVMKSNRRRRDDEE